MSPIRFADCCTLAVAGCAGDERQVARDAQNLRRLRNAIEIGAKCDDGLAGAPGGDPRGWNSGDVLAYGEVVRAQDADEIFRRFEFLEAQLPGGRARVVA